MDKYEEYISIIRQMDDYVKYHWLTIDEMKIIEDYKKTGWGEKGNPFLDCSKDNKVALAESILQYGMLFPFFSRKVGEVQYVVMGSHRLESLLLLDRCDKTFLCIELGDEFFIGNTFCLERKKRIFIKKPIVYSCGTIYTVDKLISVLKDYPNHINKEIFPRLGIDAFPFDGFNSEKKFRSWKYEDVWEV